MLLELPPLPDGPIGLERVLEALSDEQVEALGQSLRMAIDRSKRISPRQQLARSLAARTSLGRLEVWSPSERELLTRLVVAKGRIAAAELDVAQRLREQGWVFLVRVSAAEGTPVQSHELVMPLSHQLSLPWVEGESPRAARVLLAQTNPANVNMLSRHFQPRAVGLPPTLALEAVLAALLDPTAIRRLLGELGAAETALLRGVVSRGGEVDTEELLELERQPLRLQTAMGPTRARSGTSFELERRGLLLPLPPNRHCLPTEVLEVVAEHQLQRLNARRVSSLLALREGNAAPHRAQYSLDVAPLAVAMSLVARGKPAPRRSVGTPKSLLKVLAQQFGAELAAVELIAALCRKLGLWEGAAPALEFGRLGQALFEVWREGAVWDEGRAVPELQRAGKATRQPSPAAVVREVILEALAQVAKDAWVPYALLQQYVFGDVRLLGLDSQQTRFSRRTGVEVVAVAEAFDRVLFRSAFALGVLDVAEADPDAEHPGPLVRLNRWGVAFIEQRVPEAPPSSVFVDAYTVRVGARVPLAALFAVSELVEVGDLTGALQLHVSQRTLDAKLAAGADPRELLQRLQGLGQVPVELERSLLSANERLRSAEFVPCSGFIWVDDPRIIEQVRQQRGLAALFVEPSPPGGLLVVPGVPWDRLVRRCRSAGLDLRRHDERPGVALANLPRH